MESQRKTALERKKAENRRKSRARRKRRKVWILCILAVTAAAAVSVLAVCYAGNLDYPPVVQALADIRPDRNAAKGTLNAGEGKEVGDGDYWIVLNQLPTIKAGSRDCNIQFENPKENHYRSRLSLYLKSTGEQIGGTGMLDTGMYVETIQLSSVLEPGEYPLQAIIELFDKTEPAGEMTLEIILRVMEETGG